MCENSLDALWRSSQGTRPLHQTSAVCADTHHNDIQTFYGDHMTSLTEARSLRKVNLSPAAIWILQPDSSWILVICSPPLPITGEGREK